MKKVFILFILILVLVLGCIGQEPWTFHVIDEDVTAYTIEDMNFELKAIYETVIEKEIKKVKWEGVAPQEFGEGDTINFISEDGYLVSIPYDVEVILAVKKEGESIDEEEGGPLKIIVDPNYGCKCNWLKYLRIVEFVDSDTSVSVYGEVVNMLTFSSRDLNLYYGLDAVLNSTYTEVPLVFLLDKAMCKQNATTVIFITENGRYTYPLSEIRSKNPVILYENGFHLYLLGITDLKGIKIE